MDQITQKELYDIDRHARALRAEAALYGLRATGRGFAALRRRIVALVTLRSGGRQAG